MKCPFCTSDNDRVVDSRASQDGQSIRRRRECLACRRRYTTYERLEEPVMRVVKRNGTRVPFDREKLLRGLRTACAKRPVDDARLEIIAGQIETMLSDRGEGEVSTHEIGELVLDYLKDLDEVAYMRFASVYRKFDEAKDFFDEADSLTTDPRRRPR
ncbi:MAG TPA: transcriptional regulator NrdR [Pirellulales bacterium]